MIPLQSALENSEDDFASIKETLNKFEFSLGGNWDYEHGFFDRALDEEHKVWLRIPFQVIRGEMNGDTENGDAVIRLGTPFVLKHLYNDGLDGEADMTTYGALVNQFQDPTDADAKVENKWVQAASELLSRVENSFQ